MKSDAELNITFVINKTVCKPEKSCTYFSQAPWVLAQSYVERFNANRSADGVLKQDNPAVTQLMEETSAFIKQNDAGEKFADWISTWCSIQSTGLLFELSGVYNMSFAKTCALYSVSNIVVSAPNLF